MHDFVAVVRYGRQVGIVGKYGDERVVRKLRSVLFVEFFVIFIRGLEIRFRRQVVVQRTDERVDLVVGLAGRVWLSERTLRQLGRVPMWPV